MKTQINNIDFEFYPIFDDNWVWETAEDGAERSFPSAADAQQDAFRYVREMGAAERDARQDAAVRAEEARYGTYEQQHALRGNE